MHRRIGRVRFNNSTRFAMLAVLACVLSACGAAGEGQGAGKGGAGPGGAGGPPQVGFVVVQPTSVPLVSELSARVTAFEVSEVRPQVAGVIRRRLFTEGALVRQGQTLYEIDPRLYSAAASEARANLASAEATAEAARVRARRLQPLAEMEAVAQQDYTDAVATARQATASIAQTRAQLETAQINLAFTKVPAPITGRIGRSFFTVGALVSVNQADPLATIQRLDPIFVDIQQSSADLLALRRSIATDGVIPATATVRLKLEDGTDYGRAGTVQFAEVVVNASTGTVTLRARFPNPDGILLPGMFVRAAFAQAINTRAFLVPQAAVSRDPRGSATVYVVGPNNRVVQRTVRAERTEGASWVITSGINPGDRVVIQGIANLRPGIPVRPVPATAPQRVVAPPPGEGGDATGKAGAAKGG